MAGSGIACYERRCGGSSSQCSETPDCAVPGQLNEVGCCADTAVAGFTQQSGCSVWGERDPGDSDCQHGLNFHDAEAFCASVGGRLCTADELDADCTQGTGCQHDFDLLWSSTSGLTAG